MINLKNIQKFNYFHTSLAFSLKKARRFLFKFSTNQKFLQQVSTFPSIPMKGFKTQGTPLFGVKFLDDLLNASGPVMILLKYDNQTRNHRVFEKLFAAQAFDNKQADSYGKIAIRSKKFDIPKKMDYPNEGAKRTAVKNNMNMQISWRYNKEESETKKSSFSMLESIGDRDFVEFTEEIKVAEQTLLCDLGAPHERVTDKELFDLKKAVIDQFGVLLATCPFYLFENKNSPQFHLYFDIVLSLEYSDKYLTGYDGLLRIEKFVEKPETVIFGYRITKKGLEVEEYEIAPLEGVKRTASELEF